MRGRLQLDAHGGQGATAKIHIADAFELRQTLLQDRGGGIV